MVGAVALATCEDYKSLLNAAAQPNATLKWPDMHTGNSAARRSSLPTRRRSLSRRWWRSSSSGRWGERYGARFDQTRTAFRRCPGRNQRLSSRVPNAPFIVYPTAERRKLAERARAVSAQVPLQGSHGVGKSFFFAAGLVQESGGAESARRVPSVRGLRASGEAAAALDMALEKADASPIPALRGKVASLDVVVDAMQEATKLRKL